MYEHGRVYEPRPASMQDAEELVRLRSVLLNSGESHYSAQTEDEEKTWREAYCAWLADHAFRSSSVRIAVCPDMEGGKLAACAIGVIDDRAPTHVHVNGKVGWIQTVVVDPHRRRLGLGKRIVQYLCDWFLSQDVYEVTLQTTPVAQRLYQGLGFGPTGEETLVKQL